MFCCRMSHVRAIQWLCDNVDDDCDNSDNNDDDDDVSTLPSATVNANPAVVLVCMYYCVILILIYLRHLVANCATYQVFFIPKCFYVWIMKWKMLNLQVSSN